MTGEDEMASSSASGGLDRILGKFLTEKVIRPWNRLPRAVMGHHPQRDSKDTLVTRFSGEPGSAGLMGGLDGLRNLFLPK